jgi:hypothetical protein
VSKKRKKRSLPPRTLQMHREGRLQSARHWLVSQSERDPVQIVKSYRKRYGVDWPCAILEVGRLGIQLDRNWTDAVLRSLEGAQRSRARKRAERETAEAFADSDEHFAYIAGYTESGFPFGVTWAEWQPIEDQRRPKANQEI